MFFATAGRSLRIVLLGTAVCARSTPALEERSGGPGRVEDVARELVHDVSKRWSVTGGYRTVEGGADIDELYSFAWLNAAVVSGVCRF